MSRPRTLRLRLATAAVAAPLALALVACGSDDDSDDAAEDAAERAATASAAPTASAPESSTSSDAPATPAGGALMAAAETAAGAVEGSTVFSVDRADAGGWEVSVVTTDGLEYDVRVSADGGSTEGDPIEDTDDDGASEASRDLDERLRLLDVAVDLAAAIDAAGAEAGAGAGEPTGIDLDEENGAASWEVQYGEDTPDELTVVVDAGSGEVLRTERDD